MWDCQGHPSLRYWSCFPGERPVYPFPSLLEATVVLTRLYSLKMGFEKRGDASSFEDDSQDHSIQKKIKTLRHDETVRIALLALATAMGITIMGLCADVYSVYQRTYVPADYLLALWPDELSVTPTVVLVGGSATVVLTNIIALIVSKVQFVSHPGTSLPIRHHAHGHG